MSAKPKIKERGTRDWQELDSRHYMHPFTDFRALAAEGDEAKRAFAAMMTMKKIDVAAIEAARRG